MKFLKIFIVLVGFSILAVLPSMNPFEESESESCSLKKLQIDGAIKSTKIHYTDMNSKTIIHTQ